MSQFKANYEIGFEAPLGIVDKKPVHESIAIAALIRSDRKWASGTTYENLNQQEWEYIRGVIWNDDPSCLLINDKPGTNHDFGTGYDFYKEFINGPPNCMTKRSHFGNLQFLHAMATRVNEPAQETKDKLMAWLEVMYKLAVDQDGFSVDNKLGDRLPKDFDGSTVPTGSDSLKTLILATTPSYGRVVFQRRALGICLHVIQDSYAIGHTQRQLINREDLADRDQQGYIRFKPGTYGRYGAVLAFHTYPGQNEGRHSHYDQALPSTPTPSDPNSFNQMIGARDAIEASTKLINFWNSKTRWDDGVREFLSDQVFALDPKVQPSNTQVDPVMSGLHTWSCKLEPEDAISGQTCHEWTDRDMTKLCEMDRSCKLDLLEYNIGTVPTKARAEHSWRVWAWASTFFLSGFWFLVWLKLE